MKFTTRYVYRIGCYGDDYWMRRALEEALPATDGVPLDDVQFMAHEVAVAAAAVALRKYAELTPLTPGIFNSTRDRDLASVAFEGDLRGTQFEGRFVGDPRIETSGSGSVNLERLTEVRLVGHKKVIKSVVIDGETYTKETVEETSSPWFPGVTETVTMWVSGSQVCFIEE
jgi:hypothetical protein